MLCGIATGGTESDEIASASPRPRREPLSPPPVKGHLNPAKKCPQCAPEHLRISGSTPSSNHENDGMKDLAIALENRPGALAKMGETLGRAGVSIEGGGAWVVNGAGVAHFLFQDGELARKVLEAAGIRVLGVRDVLVQRLKQDVPGQLGLLSCRMAEAGINIEVLYSDHNHQLILVVDDLARARGV